jgi:TM2 domain-containing membrane protein YozV
MSGATFGRKQTVDGAAMEARRAAFIAAERARREQLADSVDHDRPRASSAAMPVYAPEKTNGTAYLLWFFLGGLSAHRFYLGSPVSAAIQLSLTPLGYGLLIGKSPAGFFILLAVWLWILSDAFVIPSLTRDANARARGRAMGPVFA